MLAIEKLIQSLVGEKAWSEAAVLIESLSSDVVISSRLAFNGYKIFLNLKESALKNPRNPHEHWLSGVSTDGCFSQFDFQ